MVHQAKTIDHASKLLGVVALAAIVAVAWFASWLAGELSFPILAQVGGVAGVVLLALPASAVLLDRLGLCPPWLKRLVPLVDEGVPGLRRRLRERLARGDAPPDAP